MSWRIIAIDGRRVTIKEQDQGPCGTHFQLARRDDSRESRIAIDCYDWLAFDDEKQVALAVKKGTGAIEYIAACVAACCSVQPELLLRTVKATTHHCHISDIAYLCLQLKSEPSTLLAMAEVLREAGYTVAGPQPQPYSEMHA